MTTSFRQITQSTINKINGKKKATTIKKGGENMEVSEKTEKEMMQKNVEEFERLQDYTVSCKKNSEAYQKMNRRYSALKVILTPSGINLTE